MIKLKRVAAQRYLVTFRRGSPYLVPILHGKHEIDAPQTTSLSASWPSVSPCWQIRLSAPFISFLLCSSPKLSYPSQIFVIAVDPCRVSSAMFNSTSFTGHALDTNSIVQKSPLGGAAATMFQLSCHPSQKTNGVPASQLSKRRERSIHPWPPRLIDSLAGFVV